MRLIDADALDMYECLKSYYGDAWRDAQEAIDNAPTIEIVRCKDCRHRYMDADLQVWVCTYGLIIKPDGFCNYGERRE